MALNKNVGNAIGDKEENDRSILGMVYLGNFTDGDDIQAKKELKVDEKYETHL